MASIVTVKVLSVITGVAWSGGPINVSGSDFFAYKVLSWTRLNGFPFLLPFQKRIS